MKIHYGCKISIAVDAPTPTVCMVEVRPDFVIHPVSGAFSTQPSIGMRTGRDVYGNRVRRFIAPQGETTITLDDTLIVDRSLDRRDSGAIAHPVHELPDDVLTYLKPSRYCDTDKLSNSAWSWFGGLRRNTSLVETICDFTHRKLRFDYQQARATRTASEAFEERVGVCRDFAHLAIALCRAMNVPARYVNGYLGDVGVPPDPAPMDFNAWFEAYLGGQWYTFDARHNCRRIGRLPIARGHDACDVPMIQTFGPHRLSHFTVVTEEVPAETEDRLSVAA